MLLSILVFFHIISGLVAGESSIRQTPEGRKSLDVLSGAGLFFLKWRAYADYKKELIGLRNICGITTIIFTTLLFIIGPTDPPSLLNALPMLFLTLWSTMQFGTNFKKSVREQFSIVGIMLIGPWLILGIDYLTNFQFNQFQTMTSPFRPFGIQNLEYYQAAIIISLLGGFIGIIIALLSTLLFSMIPLFFLFLMVTLTTLSKSALNTPPKTGKNIALLYCFIIGPILMALESKGAL
ncbi:hypothetical protein ACJJIK_02560 [Microbulbifer sp. ZKSA006]|uniref:hypothetical protein n=1 Tax=Microbulbifer sp. ZKSA006 TaxID=3243390 RepID=UPI004039CFE0